MRPNLILFALAVSSCKPQTPPLPAPQNLSVSLEEAIQEIDPHRYPEWSNHIAIHTEAFRLLLAKNIAAGKLAADALALETGRRRTAEVQRDQARESQARAQWWADYGVWLGVGGTLVLEGLIVGLVEAFKGR